MNGSPASPTDNRGISGRVLEKERKQAYLQDCKKRYQKPIENFEAALRQCTMSPSMTEARRTNTRSSKRKMECDGCQSKWCHICNLEQASKLMIVAGDNVEWTEVELEVIQEEIDTRRVTNPARIEAFQRVRSQKAKVAAEAAASTNNDDIKEEPEVKDEADVKTEPDAGNYATIGMTNNVKSEPMDSADHSTTDESSSDDGNGSEDESSLDDSNKFNDSSYTDWPFRQAASDDDDDDDETNTDYSSSDEDMDETPATANVLNVL